MTHCIKIPVVPVAKARPRIANGHAYTPKKTQEYERVIALATNGIKMTEAVSLDIVFEMPIPKSWSEKKKSEKLGAPHESRPDLDNLVKAVMDGMAACWSDDSTVSTIRAKKIYGESGSVTIVVSDDKYCRDCHWFGANHCWHPDFYPIASNKRIYGDERYTHEGVCACALFQQKTEGKSEG